MPLRFELPYNVFHVLRMIFVGNEQGVRRVNYQQVFDTNQSRKAIFVLNVIVPRIV
ncbi:hypothetical protein D3C78_1956050 [compost metagenome]